MKKRPTMFNPELRGLEMRFHHRDKIVAFAHRATELKRSTTDHFTVVFRRARRAARRALGLQ